MVTIPFRADWQIVGVVNELRELTSPKNAAWRGYLVKLAGLGSTYELHVSRELYGTVATGQLIEASGGFEYQKGELKLIARFLIPQNQEPAVRPRAAS
jgi:hypothetical protein